MAVVLGIGEVMQEGHFCLRVQGQPWATQEDPILGVEKIKKGRQRKERKEGYNGYLFFFYFCLQIVWAGDMAQMVKWQSARLANARS
jgi:hypothetical protein